MTTAPLLQANGLTKIFSSSRGILNRQKKEVRALNNVELQIFEQETLGVVGESGCGKTTLGRVIMGLLPPTAGQIYFEGRDLLAEQRNKKSSHHREMQMVFQNPYTSFDPRFTILNCVAEPLRVHTDLRGQKLVERVRELLDKVGMPGRILNRYSHEFSGGQLQRIAIARSLALNPKFIVLDEPTSALDVSVQAQIINLLKELQRDLKLTYLVISHDLGVVQHISHRVAVMYLGKIVEMSSAEAIFKHQARHPYTQALLSANPTVVRELRRQRVILKGNVPDASNPPGGCSFHPRCPVAVPECAQIEPPLINIGGGHLAACHLVAPPAEPAHKSNKE
jgi:oligopeptide/dipeptide ABC transporter ATP-binding protein